MSELADATVRITASIQEFQRVIAERLMPALEPLAAALREMWRTWPGMPYTAPSLWDASQMAAAPPTSEE